LPESEKEKKSGKAEVMAVGPGRLHSDHSQSRVPMEVKVGDKIMYRQYAGDEVKDNGEDFLILSESDIIAIIK